MTHTRIHPELNITFADVSSNLGNVKKCEYTMGTLEVSQLTKARHDSVKRTVEKLASKKVIGVPPSVEYLDSLGRPARELRLNKRDCLIVVARLNAQFMANIIDRWQELEAQQQGNVSIEVSALQAENLELKRRLFEAKPRWVALADMRAAGRSNRMIARGLGVGLRIVERDITAIKREGFGAFLPEAAHAGPPLQLRFRAVAQPVAITSQAG